MNKSKVFVPINIQRFAVGTIPFSIYTGSYNVTFQGKIEWSSVSNGPVANTSTVYCTLYARKQNSSSATTGKGWSGNITIDGTPSAFSSLSSSLSIGNDWVAVWSYSKVVSHASDGKKSITISGAIKGPSGTSLSSAYSSGSQYVALDNIPRYANITSFNVSKRDETSVSYSFSADVSIDWARYSLDNVNWYNLPSDGIVSGLNPNTSYTFYLSVRRTDSGLWSYSGGVTQSTYDYPKASALTDFIIGDGPQVTLYNPLGRSCVLELISNNDNSVIGTFSGNTAGVVNAEFKTPEAIDAQYKSIPNSPSGTYFARVTYGSIVKNSGNKTYTINYEESKPVFQNFTFEDVNEITTGLTGNPNVLVNGYSTVGVTINEENKATGTKYATIAGYNINGTLYPYSDNFYQEITNFDGTTLKIFAVDSRGNETPVEKSVVLNGYQKITKGTSSYYRENQGVSTQVNFEFEGNYWNNNFGNKENSISATYKFKKTGESDDKYIDGTTSIKIEVDETGHYSFTGILAGDTEEDSGFDIESSYDVVVYVKDKLSETSFNFVVIEGSPAIDLFGNCIALGAPYDEELGGRVQINGKAILDTFFPVGSIYLSVNSTNPSNYFGGTWEQFANGRTLVGVDTNDSDFNSVEKTGGEKNHKLSVAEMPSHNHSKTMVPKDNAWIAPNTGWNYSYTNQQTYIQNTDNTGGDQPHNNLQPYITVYMWKRIS